VALVAGMTAPMAPTMARAVLVAPVVLVVDMTAPMAMTMTPKKVIQADKVPAAKVAAVKVDRLATAKAEDKAVQVIPAAVGPSGHKKVCLRLSLVD